MPTCRLRMGIATLALFLALVSSASAECAWVLWGQTADPWSTLAAVPLGSWPSKDACERERAKKLETPRELQMATYTCFPDTVDPRRPKS